MGKQIGVIQFTGKLGETVGSKKANGQSHNIIRVRAAGVRNPRTLAQAMQRVRVRPAQNIYTALKEILDHSFEGIAYGGPSHNFFMKQALLNSVYPPLLKGDLRPAPAPYLISRGSIVSLGLVLGGDNSTFVVPGYSELTVGADVTVNNLILGNPGLLLGDQLTFVQCFCDAQGQDIITGSEPIRWTINRVVLSGTTTSADAALQQFLEIKEIDDEAVCAVKPQIDSSSMIACAVIVSRPSVSSTTGAVSWQRSTETLLVIDDYAQAIADAALKQAAIDSYMNKLPTVDSPWYLNQGEVVEDQP